MRSIPLTLTLILGILSGAANATIVESRLMPCPLCGEKYATSVVVTWNYNLSGGAGPPTPEDQCPYCLYAWRSGPTTLKPDAKRRVRAALAKFGESLSPDVRARLGQMLCKPGSPEESALLEHLVSVCDAAVNGKPIPVLRKLPKPNRQTSWSEKNRRSFQRVLPRMLAELRRGKLETLPGGFGDREMGALHSSESLIAEGDPRAAEFFIRWLTYADVALIRGKGNAVADNFAALAALPASTWPIAVPSKTRFPLMADCLHYIRSEQAASEPMRKKLTTAKWDEFSNIVTACCAARKDRSVASILRSRIQKGGSWREVDAVAEYFGRIGELADLAALTRFAHHLYRRNTEDYSRSWEGHLRESIESAIRLIHLRAAVAADSADSSQPAR